MSKKGILLSLIIVLVSWSEIAYANEVSEIIKPNSFTVGVAFGRISWDQDEVRYPGESTGTELYGTAGINFRIGYNLTRIFGFELSAGYFPEAIEGPPLLGDAETVDFSGNVIVHLLRGKFIPFLAGGYGGFAVPTEDTVNEVQGAFNYGGGIKVFFPIEGDSVNSWAFRFDVRNFAVGLEDAVNIDSLSILQFTIGLELLHLFGGDSVN